MAVLAKQTQARCKFCSSPYRTEIDELLLARSERRRDEATGQQINLAYVLTAIGALGVENPTEDNVKIHWGKHCEIVPDSVVEKQQEKRDAIVNRAQSDAPVDVDAVLDRIIRLGEADLEVRLQETGKSGVTVDQLLTAAKVKTQRRADDSTRQLLGVVGAAIGGAFVKQNQLPAPQADLELEPISEEIVDA